MLLTAAPTSGEMAPTWLLQVPLGQWMHCSLLLRPRWSFQVPAAPQRQKIDSYVLDHKITKPAYTMNVPWRLSGFPLASPPPHTHLHPGFLHQSLLYPKQKPNNILISVVLLHGPLKARCFLPRSIFDKDHYLQSSRCPQGKSCMGSLSPRLHGSLEAWGHFGDFPIDFGNGKFDV